MIGRKGGTVAPLERAINNLQAQWKSSFQTAYRHHTVPGYNLHHEPNIDNYDTDHVMQLFQEFPYDCDLPRPLLPPARLPQSALRNNDPALELLTIKSEINDDINRIVEHHNKYRRDLIACHQKDVAWRRTKDNRTQTTLPKYVAEIAELIESDPDAEFKGEYNWYYTGGCLDQLMCFDNNILLFPYAEELVAVPILNTSNSLWKPSLNIAAKCDLQSTLYEIRHTVTSDSTYNILGRQKYSCNLYSLSEVQGRFKLKESKKQVSDSPYISADLSPIDNNQYCVVRGKRKVELRNWCRRQCLSSISIPKAENLPDNWMSIKFHQTDPNLVVIVDRCCLRYIDLRTSSDTPDLTLCPKDKLEMCEHISLNFPSKHNSFYQYLGTYHNLLLCDCRFGSSYVVQKWTHQFKSPPLFAATVERNEEEVITLSSQLSGENSVILNTWTSDTQMYSYTLPYMPPSISETLRTCQEKGKCLDPNMKSRLDLCNAGTTLNLNDSNYVTLFTQNSIGDIFYQCITQEKQMGNHSHRNETSLLTLDAWEEACLKQRKTIKPLIVSEKVNMTHILNAMKSKNHNSQEEEQENGEEPKAPHHRARWFQSIAKLNSYIDILAPELLSMWDIRDDTVAPTVTPHQKVLSWLEEKPSAQNLSQSSNFTQSQADSTMFNANDILSQDLISVSQNLQSYDIPDSTVNESNVISQTSAPEMRRKKMVKKKKSISGF